MQIKRLYDAYQQGLCAVIVMVMMIILPGISGNPTVYNYCHWGCEGNRNNYIVCFAADGIHGDDDNTTQEQPRVS